MGTDFGVVNGTVDGAVDGAVACPLTAHGAPRKRALLLLVERAEPMVWLIRFLW